MAGPESHVSFFGRPGAEPPPARSEFRPPLHWCMGGKGASLARMSEAGLPVPPGFTLCVDCCRYYHEHGGRWPEGLEESLRENMTRLEEVTGRRFGEGAAPLLVSVRSGAAVSMPGMMDTILNCGLHPGLADHVAEREAFWQVYRQFVQIFARTVADIPEGALEAAGEGAAGGEAASEALIRLYEERTGRAFPRTPWGALVECVNAVFESWNNERAIIYRRSHDIRGLCGTAVNVQSMFPSRVSGIAFTANPAAPSANEMVIESSYGLGEAIVSGMVSPDRFVLDREGLDIKERAIGEKAVAVAAIGGDDYGPADPNAPSLTDDQIAEIGRIALRVEEYFGFPVDIEWGIAGGEVALLQSRAVRGLDVARDVEAGRLEEVRRLAGLAGDGRKVWVVHNLSETLPAPTPMTWDVMRRFMSGSGGFGRMYTDLGYRPGRRVLEEGFLELICGCIYVDPDRAADLFWGNMPLEYDLDDILEDPQVIESAPTRFVADKADGTFLLRLPGLVVAMIRASRRMKRARAAARGSFEAQALPAYLDYVAEKGAQDLAALSIEGLVSELESRIERVLGRFAPESLKPGFFGGLALEELEKLLVQLMGEAEGRELALGLTSGLPGDSTVEQNSMLFRIARGDGELAGFLERYGHRAVGEMELAEPRWREDPTYLERIVESYRRDGARSPDERHETNVRRREAAEAELPARLAEWGGLSLREDITDLAREAQALLPYREIGKHYLMMGYGLIRAVLVELGERWDLGRDVFFLKLDELRSFESAREKLMATIGRRKLRWQSARRLDHPQVVDSAQVDSLGLPRELDSAAEMKAVSLAAGIAEGTARIVFSPSEAGDLGENCILVCPSTDPGWTALFVNITGLVVERGGVLSHGAITARDFGIPAVACPDATKLVKEGSRVRVDGNRGQVTIVEEA